MDTSMPCDTETSTCGDDLLIIESFPQTCKIVNKTSIIFDKIEFNIIFTSVKFNTEYGVLEIMMFRDDILEWCWMNVTYKFVLG